MTDISIQRKWVFLTLCVLFTLIGTPFLWTQLPPVLQGLTLTQDQILDLQTRESLVIQDTTVTNLSLNPLTSIQSDLVDKRSAMRGNLNLQALVLQPIPDYLQGLQREILDLFLFNVFHRFSSMTGIEYWSASRQEMRIFYETSQVVNPQNPEASLPDPQFNRITGNSMLTIRQKDSSFGDNRYRVTIRPVEQTHTGFPGFHISMENLTTMRYGIVPIASPGQVMIDLTLTRDDHYFAFYGSAALGVPNIFGVRDRAARSFTNRLMAIHQWFSNELKTFLPNPN